MTFVWQRRGNPYVRVLFMGARYTAIASAMVYLFPVRADKSARAAAACESKSTLIVQDRWTTSFRGWRSLLSRVRNVSMSDIVSGNFYRSIISDLCVEDVGHMGKEPANTCIPHRIECRTVLVLRMGYALLTQPVEGWCNIGDRGGPALQIRSSWHVPSFHLCAMNRRFDFSICTQ
jgi:hypothetical protein